MDQSAQQKQTLQYDEFLFTWIQEIEEALRLGKEERMQETLTSSKLEKTQFLDSYTEKDFNIDQYPIHEGSKKEDIYLLEKAISNLNFIKNLLRSKTSDKRSVDIIYSYLSKELNISEEKRLEYDEAVRDIYIQKINEKIALLILKKLGFQIYATRVLMREYKDTDELYQSGVQQLNYYARRFKQITEMLYGKPDPELFNFMVLTQTDEATALKKANPDNPVIVESTTEFLAQFPNIAGTDAQNLQALLPTQETFEWFKAQVLENSGIGEFINLMGITDLDKNLDFNEVSKLFTNYIDFVCKRFNGGENPWEVKIEESRTTIAIDQDEQTLYMGIGGLNTKKALSLCLHEIYTHIVKRMNGEKSPLKLLGNGLCLYTDEGIATAREKALEENVSGFSGTENYFAISLAYGLDRDPNTPRDFLETFKLMVIFYKYWILKNQKFASISKDELMKQAQISAYNRTMRIFRNTPIIIPGVVDTEDLDYGEDSCRVWKLITNSFEKGVKIDWILNFGKYKLGDFRALFNIRKLEIISEETLTLLNVRL